MIGRIIRVAADALRRRPDPAAELRARIAAREDDLRRRSVAMLRLAARSASARNRDCLLFHAAAADARAEALHWTLGGDAKTAAGLTLEAEAYDRRAAQAAAETVEAAHA